ncbi:2-hydroxyglutaryl-CoA dehydratase [candidate division WOR-3 bacterium]|nr:2-hydroxyglutaryl-CoA dehydratase [candidate division WOR-3 bacterium]
MVLGLDVGSSYTKGVLFDGTIVRKTLIRTSFKPRQAIEQAQQELQGYARMAATGYGRELVAGAEKTITEITAFARGASYFEPSVRTIIDIGGQDSKVIKLKDGHVDRFVMNDRCAAGTGNFIEKIAQALSLSMPEFGELAVNAGRAETIDSLCVVMAETEILSLVGEGKRLEDIVAGVCDALVRRIDGIGSQIGIEEPILFCGGGPLNPGLVKSMKRVFGNVLIPADPQFVGAVGAALSV